MSAPDPIGPKPRRGVNALLFALAILSIPVALATGLFSALALYGGADSATELRVGIVALVVSALLPILVILGALSPASRTPPQPWTHLAAIVTAAAVLIVTLFVAVPQILISVSGSIRANEPLDAQHTMTLSELERHLDALVDATTAVIPDPIEDDSLTSSARTTCLLPNEEDGIDIQLRFDFLVADPRAVAEDVRRVWEGEGDTVTENGSAILEGEGGSFTRQLQLTIHEERVSVRLLSTCIVDES